MKKSSRWVGGVRCTEETERLFGHLIRQAEGEEGRGRRRAVAAPGQARHVGKSERAEDEASGRTGGRNEGGRRDRGWVSHAWPGEAAKEDGGMFRRYFCPIHRHIVRGGKCKFLEMSPIVILRSSRKGSRLAADRGLLDDLRKEGQRGEVAQRENTRGRRLKGALSEREKNKGAGG